MKVSSSKKRYYRLFKRKWRAKAKKNGLCSICGLYKRYRNRAKCFKCFRKDRAKRALPENMRQHALDSRDERRRIKIQVFNAYGGFCCKCCGETREPFLTIDHVNDDGYVHRKKLGSGGTRLYRWIKTNNFPPGFAVLCSNCNMGRYRNGGICPHKDLTNFPRYHNW